MKPAEILVLVLVSGVLAALAVGLIVAWRARTHGTALHRAVRAGDIERVERLIKGGTPLEAKDRDGRTPLALAVKEQETGIVKCLAAAGANIDIAVDKPGRRESLLYEAIFRQDAEILETLIEAGIDVNARWDHDADPLHLAARLGFREGVYRLVCAGARIRGGSKLHVLAWTDLDVPVVDLLAEGTPVDARDSLGRTALHIAAGRGRREMIEALVHAGASVGATDEEGWSPLHLASVSGHTGIARLLLDAGAPIDAALSRGMMACYEFAEHDVGSLHKIGGSTALHLAAMQGTGEVAALLLGAGASVAASTNAGSTALHLASRHGHLGVVARLLEVGADVHARDDRGRTPLHLVAFCHAPSGDRMGWLRALAEASLRGIPTLEDQSPPAAIVELLLRAGADPHAKDQDGRTPLDFARQQHQEILAKAMQAGPPT